VPHVPVYFRAFDVDDATDPDFDAQEIDGQRVTGIIDTNGEKGNDNNGSVRKGLLWHHEGVLSAKMAMTDEKGEATVDFTVTMQPGDNFRVAASTDRDELEKLTVDDPSDACFVPASDQQVLGLGGVTRLLTVWRRLWFEFDSMGPPPATGPEKNFEEGVVLPLLSRTPVPSGTPPATPTPVPTGTHVTLQLSISLDEANRYEEGFIEIEGQRYTVVGNNNGNEVTIVGPLLGDVSNKPFKIVDDDWDQSTGQLKVSFPHALCGSTTAPCGNNLLELAFSDAFISPVELPASYRDDAVPFKVFLGWPWNPLGWLSSLQEYKDATDADDFWVAYLLAAFQETEDVDGDPSGEDSVLGRALPFLEPVGAIYLEVTREYERRGLRLEEEEAVVHEIGHEGEAMDNDGGLMSGEGTLGSRRFSAKSIRPFRRETRF
jgi:hypothetical protein